MAIYHKKRRILYGLVEVTPGTPIATATLCSAANATVPAYGITVQRSLSNEDRNPDGNTLESIASVKWGENYTVTFETDLYTSGTAGTAVDYAKYLKACGMSETVSAGVSVTYKPSASAQNHMSIAVDEISEDGTACIRTVLAGALGSFVISTDQAGLHGKIAFTFTGKAAYATGTLQVIDSTPTTPTYADVTTNLPQFRGVAVNFETVARRISKVSFERGLSTEWEIDQSDLTTYLKRVQASSAPKVTIDPARVPVATLNDTLKFFTGATGALSLIWGTAAGKTVTLTAPVAQRESASDDGRGVTGVIGTTLKLHKSTAAGEDSFSLVYT